MLYPKINSLFKREGCGPYNEEKRRYECDIEKKPRKSALIEGEYARDEFKNIKLWTITEKIDGTNIRISYNRQLREACDRKKVYFGGRTDDAQLAPRLIDYLYGTFTFELMEKVFENVGEVILFGEGYGPKIQSGGYYRKEQGFILFDAYIDGWWLGRDKIREVSGLLGIESVPVIFKSLLNQCVEYWEEKEILEYVKEKPNSLCAQVENRMMEGIVARPKEPLLFRDGLPVMFKLKCKDF